MMKTVKMISWIPLILCSADGFSAKQPADIPSTVVGERQQEEKKILRNNFAITAYKQNYVLPFYYTRSPYSELYVNETPGNKPLHREELKFQISFKIPVWTNLFDSPTNLYFAYTQLSYWQVYGSDSFFRSTDYEPELFLQTNLNWELINGWQFNNVRLGAVHQSNGWGDVLERSWNRVYAELSASNENAVVAVRPWLVIHDRSYNLHNPDMSRYLGYGELILAYKFSGKQVISFQTHGLIEHGGRYATGTLTYSFPINDYINAYAQLFSGYGQSLVEYNHRTNSIGVGLSLSDYV